MHSFNKSILRTLLTALLALNLIVSCAMAETAPMSQIAGEVDAESGFYLVRIHTTREDASNWAALIEEDAAVALDGAEENDEGLTIRIAPVEDGEAVVGLAHMKDGVCVELHELTLPVKDGKIQEPTGGSYTASPSDEELAAVLEGEWIEAETQFTAMDIARAENGGFDVTIVSPVTHGAYVIKAVARYDCQSDALVYSEGQVYEAPITEAETSDVGPLVSEDAMGTLAFEGTSEEDLRIVWTNAQDPVNSVIFERAAADAE